MENNLEKYLKPSEFFNFHNKRVRNLAIELTKDLKSDREKASVFFYYVRDEIKYNMMIYIPKIPSNFKASVTLLRKYGFCLSKAILMATMARAVGIPARVHIVDILNHKISQKVVDLIGTKAFYGHGYAELYIDGKWLKFSPVFDKESALKGGFLPMTEFDGEHDAIFPHYDNEGNLFVEYIGDRGTHMDIDLEELDRIFIEKYHEWYTDLSGFQDKLKKNKDTKEKK